MSKMQIRLADLAAEPIPSGIVYDGVQVEDATPDEAARRWTARLYGLVGDNVLPLIIATPAGLHRIEQLDIPYDAIAAVVAARGGAADSLTVADVAQAGMGVLQGMLAG
jgi:hypothetical protein